MKWLVTWLLSCVLLQAQTTVVRLAWDTVNDASVVNYFVYAGVGGSTPATNANYYVRQAVTPVGSTNTQYSYITVNNGPTTFWVTSATSLIESDPSTSLSATIPTVTVAPNCQLSVAPTSIIRGQTTTVSWNVVNAVAVGAELNPGVGSVSATGGSLVLTPSITTPYVLTVWNSIGTNTCTATITVVEPAPTFTFTRSPTTILVGASSTLTWSALADTVSATIDNGVGSASVAGGTAVVSPVATTVYTLTASGPGGITSKSAVVTVDPALAADFSITPTTLMQGDSATLNWTTYGTCSGVTIDQGVGAKPCGTGSQSVSPLVNTTYTMITAGTGGPVTNTATVVVVIPPPPPPPPVPTPGPTVATTAMRKAILIR